MEESTEPEVFDWLPALQTLRAEVLQIRRDRGFTKPDYFIELGPPLTEGALIAVEDREGVSLPADYRDFLSQVGVGCAPPGYNGLGPPASYSDRSDPTRPFPLRRAAPSWKAPAKVPPRGSRHLEDGLLSVASLGCGYSAALVVTGPCAGQVWHDYRAGDGAMQPEAPSFAAWYTQQLHHVLREILWGELARATETQPHTQAPHHDILLRRAALFDEPTAYLGGLEGHLLMPLYQGLRSVARARLHQVEREGHTIAAWLRQRIV